MKDLFLSHVCVCIYIYICIEIFFDVVSSRLAAHATYYVLIYLNWCLRVSNRLSVSSFVASQALGFAAPGVRL